MLTHKQDKFARLVAEGKDQSSAYRESYNSAKMKPETITNSAYKLMQNGELTARIKELKKEFTKNLDLASQITVERQLKTIQLVLNPLLKKAKDKEVLTDGEVRSVVSLTQEQNKLIGLYAPTKTDGRLEIRSIKDLIETLDDKTN